MMSRFVVVTDSTSNLGPELADEYGVSIIPLNVHWGEETYLDGVTLDVETFYRWLRERDDFPKTSQPSAGAFIDFFEKVAEERGVDTIMGIFISTEMSGTLVSALQAKAELESTRPDLTIVLHDSRSVSMGLGLQALVAARAANEGLTVEEAMARIRACYDNLHVVFAVDTLEFLHRGGRIGGAARLVGSALNLKPVLTIEDGRIEPLERVRSRRKSLRRIIQIAEERLQGRRPTELAIMQAEAEEDLPWFSRMVSDRLKPERLYTEMLTPVVGTHAGPGTIGIAFYTLDGDG
ncbi:MAG: DegV family protein [Anaerolineae bacterium]